MSWGEVKWWIYYYPFSFIVDVMVGGPVDDYKVRNKQIWGKRARH